MPCTVTRKLYDREKRAGRPRKLHTTRTANDVRWTSSEILFC